MCFYLWTVLALYSLYWRQAIPVVHSRVTLRCLFNDRNMLFTVYVFPVPACSQTSKLWPLSATLRATAWSWFNMIYRFDISREMLRQPCVLVLCSPFRIQWKPLLQKVEVATGQPEVHKPEDRASWRKIKSCK